MDELKISRKTSEFISKYKYPVIIVLAGLFLMLLPEKDQKNVINPETDAYISSVSVQDELERILGMIDGAGEVAVLLTEYHGQETVYQTNIQSDTDESATRNDTTTVIVTGKESEDLGLVRRVDPPEYLGAIIVCQGAGNPQVRLAIVEAVSRATGLGANQISIVKMR